MGEERAFSDVIGSTSTAGSTSTCPSVTEQFLPKGSAGKDRGRITLEETFRSGGSGLSMSPKRFPPHLHGYRELAISSDPAKRRLTSTSDRPKPLRVVRYTGPLTQRS
jgi:hypothetical protein